MSDTTKYKNLFSPLQIGSLRLDNRIVAAATVTNLASANGSVTDRLIDLYSDRAAGGAGLITVEMSAVQPTGRAWNCMLGIWDDRFIPGLDKLVDAIHSQGTKCSVQLGHSGRQTTSAVIGTRPLAPSSISQYPPGHPAYLLPRALSPAEITHIVNDMVKAVNRAKQAGFDAVELHGAHGYLFHQFLSPAGNIRNDAYGGNTSNRCKILRDIIKGIRKTSGSGIEILCKIDGNEHVEGGIDLAEAVKIAACLESAGVDSILVSAGCAASIEYLIPPAHMPSALNLEDAREIKKHVNIPVGVVGKIDDFQQADSIIDRSDVDYVAIARPLLCDPALPLKLSRNTEQDIRHCIYCNEKCTSIDDQLAISCVRNPFLGGKRLGKTQSGPKMRKKRVAIIGGGAAGLKAAKTAAEQGNDVHLFEKAGTLGGQVNLVSKLPYKKTWNTIVPYFETACEKLNVTVECGQEASMETIRALKPDVVILATGAIPDLDRFDIAEGARTVSAFEAMTDPDGIDDEVVVVGGQRLAVDTCIYLASLGKRVSLVSRGSDESYLARNIHRSIRPHIVKSLSDKKITILYGASLRKIEKENLHINVSGTDRKFPFKTAVLATYLKPVLPPFIDDIQRTGAKVYRIGDCVFPRGLAAAISEGFETGLMV